MCAFAVPCLILGDLFLDFSDVAGWPAMSEQTVHIQDPL